MAFTNPNIHDVVGVEAEFTRIDDRPNGGEPFAVIKLHLTTARDTGQSLKMANGTVEIFFPDGAQEYAARLADAINAVDTAGDAPKALGEADPYAEFRMDAADVDAA